MRIALINGKGGSGKTTATMLLALAFREGGHRGGVFDTDPHLGFIQNQAA
jgi:cellulose biosynthesis protein BcsQ